MPTYDYRCLACGKVFETFRVVAMRHDVKCECGGDVVIQIGASVAVRGDLEPYYCEGLGEVVQNRAHRMRLMKEKGLEEIGDMKFWQLEREASRQKRQADEIEAKKPPPKEFIEAWNRVQAQYPVQTQPDD